MLPYIHLLYITLGPVKIFTWGFFVSLGFLIALLILIKKYPAEKNIFIDTLLYVLLGAIIGARLFFLLFYTPEISAALKDFYKIWQGGMSSFGGFFGGFAAIYFYARAKKINLYILLQKVVFVLPLGLAISRIGCYLINDHPGVKTIASPLSVAYPGGPRFDLGLLLFVFNAMLFAYFVLKPRKTLYLESFLIIYGIGRFLLDFLRVGEPQYYGLIPSQYGSILMIGAGLYLIKYYKNYAR